MSPSFSSGCLVFTFRLRRQPFVDHLAQERWADSMRTHHLNGGYDFRNAAGNQERWRHVAHGLAHRLLSPPLSADKINQPTVELTVEASPMPTSSRC